MPRGSIQIRGARTHNLKNVDVDLPHGELAVITGPSGSGKSSLAFDTLYAEGQRRFVESMSTYVRQFLERMERPDVDAIDGVLPALAIEQKNSVKNARSTVATATELADYVRLFITYVGETWCPDCDHPVRRESPESVSSRILEKLEGRRIMVLAPVFFPDEGREALVAQLLRAGFYRIWVHDEVADLKDFDWTDVPMVQVVAGRLRVSEDDRARLTETVENAFQLSKGAINVLAEEPEGEWSSYRFSSSFACDTCGREFPDPVPHLFSFNSPLGACPTCQGYGRVIGIDMDRVIPDRTRTLDEMPIDPWNSPGYEDTYADLRKAARTHRLRMDVPISKLREEEWDILYNGRGRWYGIRGFFDWLETKKYKVHVRVKLARYRSYETCTSCSGSRLKPEALNVRFRGLHVGEVFRMNVRDARAFWTGLELDEREESIAGHLRREILNRLVYLDEVGLSYLTLDRQTRTLSGGESQRINLAAALGSGLTETLYVVDEPTVGLHARDSERLLEVLRRLKDRGNTVIVVEHDPTMIDGADNIVELGPGAGELGGEVLYNGPRESFVTAIPEPPPPRVITPPPAEGSIIIRGASENNLQNVDAEIPLGRLVAVTGVSGSGKSTLIRSCLYNGYQRRYQNVASLDVGRFTALEGLSKLRGVELVDQSPIGRSTRSNPATYVKAWDEIRKLMASTTSAKLHNVTPGMFSFNTAGGRCDACEGSGTVIIDMQFLADVEVVCEQCGGKRFKEKVLKVTWKGRNIDDILGMTVDEACRFFIDKRSVIRKLDPLRAVGLGYLRVGQSTASLSGGEAQRLKLAAFLSGGERQKGGRLFLFDEPTTGLHSSDVARLIDTFRALVEAGNSLVVIEHNIQLIEAADWVIDLGPGGGDEGGRVIATGTPAQVAGNRSSVTGEFLFRDPSFREEAASSSRRSRT